MAVNGLQDGLWNFENMEVPEGVNVSGAIAGALERDRLRVNQTSTSFRFNGDAYLKLPAGAYADSENTNIIIRFKTTVQEGLLCLTFQDQNFILLEIRSGFLFFRVSDPSVSTTFVHSLW